MTTVTVKQGKLEGELSTLPGGRTYRSFRGVPYAKPPVGKLRFRTPQPVEPWTGVRKATEYSEKNPQWDFFDNKIYEGNEDCLYLNVFTPHNESHGKLLPVMFYIHGGGWYCGSGDDLFFGPDPLMFEDIVLVTINYRLGPFGFLCLDIPEVPGNMGMKDQVLALKWVQENIINFGGDENNVTIFGESAGGASVTFHMVSPMSRGLFHKAIPQSGSFLNEWAFEPNGTDRSFQLGKDLGFETTDSYKMLEFLENVPAGDLKNVFPTIVVREEFNCGVFCPFIPVVEKVKTEQTFLPDYPLKLLQQGNVAKVPVMIGYTNAEGLITLRNVSDVIKYRTHFPELSVPRRILWKIPLIKSVELGKEIKKYFFGNDPIILSDSLVNLQSDIHVNYDIDRIAKLMTKQLKNIFYYIFTCESDRNILKRVSKTPDLPGVCHADDLNYLFQSRYNKPIDINSESFKYVRQTTTLWANFARTGNPTPDSKLGINWKEYTEEEQDYMIIDKQLKMDKKPTAEAFAFWDGIYDKAEKFAPQIS